MDWESRNLYWTDQGLGQLTVSRLDGQYEKILLSGLARPHAITIDQLAKWVMSAVYVSISICIYGKKW